MNTATTTAKISPALAAIQDAAAPTPAPTAPTFHPTIFRKAAGDKTTYETRLEPLDIEAELRRGDDSTRKIFLAALAAFDAEHALVRRARDVRYSEAAIAELRKAGLVLDEELEADAYFRAVPGGEPGHFVFRSADHLGNAEKVFAAQILQKLEGAVEPETRRLAQLVVDDFSAELARIEEIDRGLAVRWAGKVSTQEALCAQLRHAIARLNADLARPFDMGWHPNPRTVLNRYLPASSPL
ncbi:MAG: hypothetical protein KF715_05000 [Candidatus Didemnitutus sp.]|nr:hypothetical protein [Candidatus Didemnitutus sp.]